MVSIAQRIHSSTGDEVTFNHSMAHSSNIDSEILLEPVVGGRPRNFGYLCTGFVAFLHLSLTIIIGVFVVVLSTVWPRNDRRECESYFIALYLNALYWVSSFIFDFYLRRKHKESRVEGYLEFYTEIIPLARAPFYIVSIWSTIFLTLASIFHQMYGDMTGHCSGNFLDPLHYVSALMLIQVVINSSILISYMVKVNKFNNLKVCPDALRDDWMANFIRVSYSGGEIGLREREDHIVNLLEKQADLLRNLKEQNARLVQKVMILSLQLQEKHGASVT